MTILGCFLNIRGLPLKLKTWLGIYQFSIEAHFKSHTFSSSTQKTLLSAEEGGKEENELIFSATTILKEHRSKSRWNYLKASCPQGFNPQQVSQIIINLRNKPHLALAFFYWSAKQKQNSYKHNLLSYCTIIHILARARLKNHVRSLILKAMVEEQSLSLSPEGPSLSISELGNLLGTLIRTYRSCDSCPLVFDLLIEGHLRAKKVDCAAEIVRLLVPRGLHPSIGILNTLLRLVSQSKGSNEGLSFFKEIFGNETRFRAGSCPNIQTFNTLILALYREGKLERENLLFDEMSKMDCKPNTFSYNVLIAAYCEKRKLEEAVELWDGMLERGLTPDIVAYNTLIGGYCDIGDINHAEAMYREMTINGISPTCLTYEHLIHGHCKSGSADEALLLYKDMCRHHFEPNGSTINEIVGLLCIERRTQDALEFQREIVRKYGVRDRESYDLLINGLCAEGKVEEALAVQAEMVCRGFGPNIQTYRAFIDGYAKLGDANKAEKLRKEMLDIGLVLDDP
ncbi:hypothetical protein AMTRI_Chr13g125250 [Amborella trichopoda]